MKKYSFYFNLIFLVFVFLAVFAIASSANAGCCSTTCSTNKDGCNSANWYELTCLEVGCVNVNNNNNSNSNSNETASVGCCVNGASCSSSKANCDPSNWYNMSCADTGVCGNGNANNSNNNANNSNNNGNSNNPNGAVGTANGELDFTSVSKAGLPDSPGIKNILVNILNWLLRIIGIITVIAFIISGGQYLLASGDEKIIEIAKRNMTYSIIGIIVALSGFVAVRAIDTALRGTRALF